MGNRTSNSYKKNTIITIDGPSAVGKTTIGIKLSEKLSLIKNKPFLFLDTGIVYRLAAYLQKLNNSISKEEIKNRIELNVNYEEKYPFLYTEEIALLTSKISQQENIRQLLTSSIREKIYELSLESSVDGFILTGRDCGTVIFPEADYKFFLYATPETRAHRRLNQYKQIHPNSKIKFNEILEKIKQRDFEDTNRKISPLPTIDNLPPSFILIITDNLSVEETIEKMINYIN
ncbi:MAG: (d)CMP kinase [bacterium]